MGAKKLITILVAMWLIVTPGRNAHAYLALELTQVLHTMSTANGWITEAYKDILDYVEQLNMVSEAIQNNFLTDAIRGFNELQTAIQTDISDVLGTVETLVAAPMQVFEDIMTIPTSLMGTIEHGMGEFENLFYTMTDTFGIIGEAQALGQEMGDMFQEIGAGNAFGFANQISGLRTTLNSEFLAGSAYRQQVFDSWSKPSYGQDQAQQDSTRNDMIAGLVRQQNHDSEMAAMDRMQEAADRMAIYEQLEARAAAAHTRTSNYLTSMMGF